MDLKLRGSSVLVTGSSQGLGRALALAFAGEGAKVAVCARNKDRLHSTADAIVAQGAECLALQADLLQAADCQRVVDETARHFGCLDVLVNNASTNVDKAPQSLADATDAQISERFLGKTMAAIRCARAALPHMRRSGGGRIVSIGGTAARTVFRKELGVSGSVLPQGIGNAALANFSKFLAEEAAADQITVNVVHPHAMRGERYAERVARRARELGCSPAEAEAAMAAEIPIGRMVDLADVTPLVLFLASSLSSAITGQAIAVDGGAVRLVAY